MKRIRSHVLPLFLLAAALAGTSSCESLSKPQATQPQAEDDFWALMERGETEKARQLFLGKADIKNKDAQGRTALHVAVEKKDAALVAFFIALGADVDAKDNQGRTPLQIACEQTDLASVKALSAGKANIFLAGSTGKAPADFALEGTQELLAAVVQKDNVNSTDPGDRTILQMAAIKGNRAAVKQLLDLGAQCNLKDKAGKSALDAAYANPDSLPHAEIAELLIMAGAVSGNKSFSYFPPAVRSSNYNIRFEDGLVPLHMAAREGHLGFIQLLLNKKVDVGAKTASGSTALHEAIRAGKIEAARILIQAGSDVNARDAKGNSAMHLVMPLETRKAGLELLLANKADPNIKDAYGDAPLHVAIALNMGKDIVQTLLQGKADPNIRNTAGRTPLHTAIERERAEYLPLLLERGADIFAADIKGETPFDVALTKGGPLLEGILTPVTVVASDNRGNTPLHIAVEASSSVHIVSMILERQAAVNARNKSGDTPLHLAVKHNLREVGELLISQGADIFSTNSDNQSPLQMAAMAKDGFREWILNSRTIEARDGLGNGVLHHIASWKLDALIQLVVQRGVNPEAKNATGETPIFAAVKADSPSTVAALVAVGASTLSRDSLGNSALHAAVRWNALKSSQALITGGADVNARNLAGKTPLHEAVRLGMVDQEALLLKSGADIEGRDLQGITPLMEAINAGLPSATERLLDRGASPNARSATGDTPLHLAVIIGKKDIANILLARGASIHSKNAAGVTPFTYALIANPQFCAVLLTKDRLNQTDDAGNGPLHLAILESSSPDLIRSICALGVRLSDPDAKGRTALRLAIEKELYDQVSVLVAAGSDIFITAEDGESALSLAIAKGNPPAIKALFSGGNIKAKDQLGNTALHYAASKGSPATIQLLLELGAVKNAKNVEGETPADVARRWGKKDSEKLLL